MKEESTLPAIVRSITPVLQRELLVSPVMDLELAKSRIEQFEQFVQYYLQPSQDGGMDGGDFGPIPGAGKKKVLLKSGADKLTELYGLYDEYQIEAQENFETKLFYYKITCTLKSRRDDSIVGTGLGSCSTYESKYRWRDSQRSCPKCKAQSIIKGKDDFGGGWLCWAKKGGCGQKFKDGDASIESQVIGRVENPDIMDTVNTVLKMAKKRAKIDAVIGVTRSSGIFTQDLEDVPMPPVKPPVERTTEEIPLARPVKVTAPASQKGQAKTDASAEAPAASATVPDAVTPAPLAPLDELVKQVAAGAAKMAMDSDGYIDSADAAAIYMHVKKFVPKGTKEAAIREIIHTWCKSHGLVDVKGDGTLLKVRKTYIVDGKEVSGVTRTKDALETHLLDILAKQTESK